MNTRTLVLNKHWAPVNVVPVWNAIAKVFKGRALFLDTETFATYDFESWVGNWTEAVRSAKIVGEQAIRVGSDHWMRVPDVVVCTEYRGFGYRENHRRPKFSRVNIYRRDRNQCQFCGKRFITEDLTLDHVVPKSKGGGMSWSNVVLACVPCNAKKGDRTPNQAGMKLIRNPVEPSANALRRSPAERIMYKVGASMPKTWETFLGKMYWSAELSQ